MLTLDIAAVFRSELAQNMVDIKSHLSFFAFVDDSLCISWEKA